MQGIRAKISSKGARFEQFFEYCYRYKRYWLDRGFDTPLLNAVIFKKLRDATGGKIKLVVSGGAPLAADVQDFLRVCLFDLALSYGLTESAGRMKINTSRGVIVAIVIFSSFILFETPCIIHHTLYFRGCLLQ